MTLQGKNKWLINLFLLTLLACKNDKEITMLKDNNNEIKLEVDSLDMPEMTSFTILLKLINNSNYKAILFFDSLPNEKRYRKKNLSFILNKDTSYVLGSRDKYLVLEEHSITSFICYGYFGDKKGFFKHFNEIENNFPKGKIVYTFSGKIPQNINQEKLLLKADTFLVPNKLEATTENVVITNQPIAYPPPPR